MVFYDFEVFKFDWLVVLMDTEDRKTTVFHNDRDGLQAFYDAHKSTIWTGYNSRHYDVYILKGILLGMDPKWINDQIILNGVDGWRLSSDFNRIQFYNFDIMPNPPVGLKTLEGFLGSNIKETDVPFDIDRALTPEELEMTEKYCRHDVEETMKVFLQRKDQFNAMMGIVTAFDLPLSCIGNTEAQITAKVLQCEKHEWDDEYQYFFFPCERIEKYKDVVEWFRTAPKDAYEEMQALGMDPSNEDAYHRYFYDRSYEREIAGVPHSFGFGGLHGAPAKPMHYKGQILHVDVNNYYPSMLIAWGIVTRAADAPEKYAEVYNTRKALKMKQIAAKEAGNKALAKKYKSAQLPYKKLLNSLSGAMKDRFNPAYDPRNNNTMCINGQLMMLDLIEKLEVVPGFQLIQTNTDGLIIQIPDTQEAFDQVDDICWEWEQRCSTDKCSIRLELDQISEIYQKDVNNYLWIDLDGGLERKGAYVKELSAIDNDLPIINEAIVERMVNKTPVRQTIEVCTDLIKFQKIVKLSSKYRWVEHEEKGGNVRFSYNSYRVFASADPEDGRILKCGGQRGKPEKFGNTPAHCFIYNDALDGVKTPEKLDREWYIALAEKRLKDYGL